MFGLSELKKTRVYQQGREEGREEAVAALLQRRFSVVDPVLQSTIPQLAMLPFSQALDLILERSREEILDRFSP